MDLTDLDLIIDRDLLDEYNLIFIYSAGKANLSAEQLSHLDVYFTGSIIELILDDCKIDFDPCDKIALKNITVNIEKGDVQEIDENYYVRVNLKDTSTYAYARVILRTPSVKKSEKSQMIC